MSRIVIGFSLYIGNAQMPTQVNAIQMITSVIAKEIHKQTIQDEILRPLLKWLLRYIMPYGIMIMVLNFFITVCAVSVVLYFKR